MVSTTPGGRSWTSRRGTASSSTWEGDSRHLKALPPRMNRIRIWVEDVPVTATLEDNETALEFASLLPLTLTLEDYASTEKIADLPRRLSTQGAPPAGSAGAAGEIAYFPPWGNLAVFYRDFRYSH